ncbi:hypothetical protein L1887_07861 [Cichorium endivia]|nr:hypothetical protein L1887_07861 [Cichorium endivia]
MGSFPTTDVVTGGPAVGFFGFPVTPAATVIGKGDSAVAASTFLCSILSSISTLASFLLILVASVKG